MGDLSKQPHKWVKYFQLFYNPDNTAWFHNRDFSHKSIVSINRLRAGHTSLADSLFKHNIIESPRCDCGHSNQTPNHVFWQCHLFDSERETFLNHIRPSIPSGPYCLEQLLTIRTNSQSYGLTALTKFIDKLLLRI